MTYSGNYYKEKKKSKINFWSFGKNFLNHILKFLLIATGHFLRGSEILERLFGAFNYFAKQSTGKFCNRLLTEILTEVPISHSLTEFNQHFNR